MEKMKSGWRFKTVYVAGWLTVMLGAPMASSAQDAPAPAASAAGGYAGMHHHGPRDPLMAKYLQAHLAGDDKAALGYLTQAADAGNADAQAQLSDAYRGEGDLAKWVTPDAKKADALMQSAIAHGSTFAMEAQGVKLMNGSAGHQDYAAAFELFSRSDKAGSMKAGRYLGMFYQHGWSVPVDEAKAVAYYRRAAEVGDITSQCLLGAMYEGGLGVQRSDELAAQWYEKSSERGDLIASGGMSALGHLYETRTDGQRDLKKAAEWYAKSAAVKNVDGLAAVERLAAGKPAQAVSPSALCVSPAHH
jgi:uncharacterized protein